MTTNDAPLARMDVPAVRDARIRLRVAELRVLAAETAVNSGVSNRSRLFDCNCWCGQL
jgi:hypothetical protein